MPIATKDWAIVAMTFGADEAAVEQGEPRHHEEDERGRGQHPGGVARGNQRRTPTIRS